MYLTTALKIYNDTGQEQKVTPNIDLQKCNRVLAQAGFYQSQQEELQFILRQLVIHDLYSVLPELNQTPSMYSQGPSYKTKLNDISDPHETKFTARTMNDTVWTRERREFGSILVQAIPGLITLAIESVSSYIKGRQQQKLIPRLKH